MKRISSTIGLVAIVATLAGTILSYAPSSASALICIPLPFSLYMKYGVFHCGERLVEARWTFEELLGWGKALKGNEYCAEVESGKGHYTNANCTEEGAGNFIKVEVPATPSVLPEATEAENIVATSKAGTSTFGSGLLEVTSSASKGTVTFNSLRIGSFTTKFESVGSMLGPKCLGLSDTTPNAVTVSGLVYIRDFKASGTLSTAAVFLLTPVHFSCESILVVVSGCVAGTVTPENTLTKTVTINLEKTGGDNKVITVLNIMNSEEEACQLLSQEGTGTTKLTSLVTKQTISEIKKGSGSAGLEVLVMRL
jgi:hypothetical protein